jgi:8-oxo-dGTP diphosphatase
MELPMNDKRGGSLVSFARLHDTAFEGLEGAVPPACSLVVVGWDQRVLVGFNVTRQQWELPGGSLEAGESAYDAAIRELVEETGIRAERVSLVARAEFMFGYGSTRHVASVFAVLLSSAPNLVVNDELSDFEWWDPTGEVWDGLSPLDAEVARRCLPHENAGVTIEP